MIKRKKICNTCKYYKYTGTIISGIKRECTNKIKYPTGYIGIKPILLNHCNFYEKKGLKL